ncbi:hypothetical protein HPB51_029519 [Rhipicephalus microplus]|uniref:Uncharacterized protein n=1 Tax=Rhipicephalus microplus TaxID=6941 RepID=A0A9J6CUJ7_RHIMP|nr:hypothetical protein HPB51_029519 [Rhipicephalus microplus]
MSEEDQDHQAVDQDRGHEKEARVGTEMPPTLQRRAVVPVRKHPLLCQQYTTTTTPGATANQRAKVGVPTIQAVPAKRQLLSQHPTLNKGARPGTGQYLKLEAAITDPVRDQGRSHQPDLKTIRKKWGNLQLFVCNCERKPDVILLQKTNDPVKHARYKATDAAASSEEQRKKTRRVASTGVMAMLPASAVPLCRNLTVAQRELQEVKIPHVFVELIPGSGQGLFVLNM